MKTHFAAILCAALAPLAAFALSDYIDEYVDEVTDELEEWGVPVGDGAEEPAAPGLKTAQKEFPADNPSEKRGYEKFEVGLPGGYGDGFTLLARAG
jgi:hypothetical protein